MFPFKEYFQKSMSTRTLHNETKRVHTTEIMKLVVYNHDSYSNITSKKKL